MLLPGPSKRRSKPPGRARSAPHWARNTARNIARPRRPARVGPSLSRGTEPVAGTDTEGILVSIETRSATCGTQDTRALRLSSSERNFTRGPRDVQSSDRRIVTAPAHAIVQSTYRRCSGCIPRIVLPLLQFRISQRRQARGRKRNVWWKVHVVGHIHILTRTRTSALLYPYRLETALVLGEAPIEICSLLDRYRSLPSIVVVWPWLRFTATCRRL